MDGFPTHPQFRRVLDSNSMSISRTNISSHHSSLSPPSSSTSVMAGELSCRTWRVICETGSKISRRTMSVAHSASNSREIPKVNIVARCNLYNSSLASLVAMG